MVNCSVSKSRAGKNNVIPKIVDHSTIEKFKDPSKVGFNLFEDTPSEKNG